MNILLVDDDPDEQQAFAKAIPKLGLPITLAFAQGYEQLMEILDTQSDINLIFLDINMPVKNGKKCLRELKSNEKYKHIPVLVYTVSQSIEDINEVYRDGAHYYAIKPYAETNFIETLKLIFDIDWTIEQQVPRIENFVINLAFI